MTRTLSLAGFLALGTLAGCKGFDGPRAGRDKPRVDAPQYTIEEQQRRGRDKYAIPEDDVRIGPRGFIDRPSPTGR